MGPTTKAVAHPAVTIDETTITRVAWVLAGAVLLSALLFASWYLVVAAALGVAVAFGVTSYLENESARDFRVPLNTAWITTIDALADNGFAFGEPTLHGVTEGTIVAGDAKIRVEQHPGGVTRIRVRVGTLALPDNRRRAALVMERVEKYLSNQETIADFAL